MTRPVTMMTRPVTMMTRQATMMTRSATTMMTTRLKRIVGAIEGSGGCLASPVKDSLPAASTGLLMLALPLLRRRRR